MEPEIEGGVVPEPDPGVVNKSHCELIDYSLKRKNTELKDSYEHHISPQRLDPDKGPYT
jgi:hypothetical protein